MINQQGPSGAEGDGVLVGEGNTNSLLAPSSPVWSFWEEGCLAQTRQMDREKCFWQEDLWAMCGQQRACEGTGRAVGAGQGPHRGGQWPERSGCVAFPFQERCVS